MAVTSYTVYYVNFPDGRFQPVACDQPPTWVDKVLQGEPYRDLNGQDDDTVGTGDPLLAETVITPGVASPPRTPNADDTATTITAAIEAAMVSLPDDRSHIAPRGYTYSKSFLTFTDSTSHLCGEFPEDDIDGWSNYPPGIIPTDAPAVFPVSP